MLTVKDIYQELVYGETTWEFYETCYGEFIIEAIEKTLKDLKLYRPTKKDVKKIHKHIIANYI